MVMEATSLGCSSPNSSGELPLTPSLILFSVMTAVSSASVLLEVGASRGSRGSGESKPEELSQFCVEEETWEMTGIWTEEEDEAVVVAATLEVLPR